MNSDYQDSLTRARREAHWRAIERMRQNDAFRAQMRADWARYRKMSEANGKRWEQCVFSAVVLLACLWGGVALGTMVALVEWLGKQ